ncbi:hypothetical protein B9Z55_025718 [Caenorhabditis nigoni]|uniref:Uncharacterized protein n=1 Tax=Caenorhabditis nigoni TaxID=1611254 RepID=A0A2G5T015_9PELO|nr:hypothetical protein B9Z55_025718 [Caenorhabditis nigoni]
MKPFGVSNAGLGAARDTLLIQKLIGGGYVRDIIPPNNTETPWNTIAPPANPTTNISKVKTKINVINSEAISHGHQDSTQDHLKLLSEVQHERSMNQML